MLTSNIPIAKYKLELNSILYDNYSKFSTLLNNHFSEENYQGSSCYYRKLQQLIFAYYLAIYIKKRLYFGETLTEIEADLDIDNVIFNLNCNNIRLYSIYDLFEITY